MILWWCNRVCSRFVWFCCRSPLEHVPVGSRMGLPDGKYISRLQQQNSAVRYLSFDSFKWFNKVDPEPTESYTFDHSCIWQFSTHNQNISDCNSFYFLPLVSTNMTMNMGRFYDITKTQPLVCWIVFRKHKIHLYFLTYLLILQNNETLLWGRQWFVNMK